MPETNTLSSNGIYKPHNYLKKAIAGMKDYCLPQGE